MTEKRVILELMPLSTLWESICSLAGTDGTSEVRLGEAVEKSAVPRIVADVEVKRLLEDGFLVGEGEIVRLTERGRRTCFDVHATSEDNGTIAPE